MAIEESTATETPVGTLRVTWTAAGLRSVELLAPGTPHDDASAGGFSAPGGTAREAPILALESVGLPL